MNGCEWVVEAHGCDPLALADMPTLRAIFAEIVNDLGLHPLGAATWHQFPEPGGITGLELLSESHLACHTFPEYASACFNLFCCRPRPEWDFASRLAHHLGAASVSVRRLDRPYRVSAPAHA
jgi:S-adenosylmethionine decarboxylase